TGAINIEALQLALLAIIERHEALRTVMLEDEDGIPMGCLLGVPKLSEAVELVTLKSKSRQEIEDFIFKITTKAFKLDVDRPLRTHLLQLTDDEYALVLTFHHHANDGVSANI
ncbi:condensation domain-containing protein, partial [Polynucleobacter yangtzensis]